MKSFSALIGLLAAILLVAPRCAAPVSGEVRLDPRAEPFEKLSDYGFFLRQGGEWVAHKQLLPYDLISPLFSDYASKDRYVYLPDGSAATYREDEVFDFPVGSALIKHFYYPDERSSGSPQYRLLETRLLIRRADGWDALPYVWDADMGEALLKVAGDATTVQWRHPDGELYDFSYLVPNKNQCKGCHTYENRMSPIGPSARNLNRPIDYGEGPIDQLEAWAATGFLEGLPDAPRPSLVDYADQNAPLADRAMAYLEINCGHCHRPEGPANTSGLHLTTFERNPANLGFCKSPVAAGKGSGGLLFDILPGHPQSSILLYRMKVSDPGIRMPEVGRQLRHKEGVELIADWIASLEGDCEVSRP